MVKLIALIILLISWIPVDGQKMGFDMLGTTTNHHKVEYGIVTLDTLEGATSLSDLYERFRSSWVEKYRSVTMTSSCNNKKEVTVLKNDHLSTKLLAMLRSATSPCNVHVLVDYIPRNSLKDNPPREMDFTLTIIPIFEAKYPEGKERMESYLREHILEQIKEFSDVPVDFAKVSFKVDVDGRIIDVQLEESTDQADLDQLMVNAICKMPEWIPAKNAAGVTIQQDFEFTMGTDLLRCDYYFQYYN